MCAGQTVIDFDEVATQGKKKIHWTDDLERKY